MADQDSVEEICQSAPEVINMLSELGVQFDRMKDGAIDQKIYGGQSTEYGKGTLLTARALQKIEQGIQ